MFLPFIWDRKNCHISKNQRIETLRTNLIIVKKTVKMNKVLISKPLGILGAMTKE